MKTPDEIKKGLEYCMSRYCAGAKCPYYNAKSCNEEKTADVLAYIQQLEHENERLLSSYDAALCEAADLASMLLKGEPT